MPILIVLNTPRIVVPKRPKAVISTRIVPKTELPAVEPVALQEVDQDDARSINASIPFSSLPNPAARPFKISGSPENLARAIDCLAAGVIYEAGDDSVGQRAVAQVVINRMRHPAFPKSICGVVFQGQERSTGCQFTFTCDGALTRWSPNPGAWQRAREVAQSALNGAVYRKVGHATHYHTDWVVPYWSASLEKITAVDTHLFFRWAGWWGTPPAFNRGHAGSEPNVPKLAALSPAHYATDTTAGAFAAIDGSATTIVDPASIPAEAVPAPLNVEAGGDNDVFMLTLPAGMSADSFAALAVRTCGERLYCKFMAWADARHTPARIPLNSTQVSNMSFSYLRDEHQGFAKALWNCQQYKRPSPVQCMRVQALAAPSAAVSSVPRVQNQPQQSSDLSGVRRKREMDEIEDPQSVSPAPRPSAPSIARPAPSIFDR